MGISPDASGSTTMPVGAHHGQGCITSRTAGGIGEDERWRRRTEFGSGQADPGGRRNGRSGARRDTRTGGD